MAAFPETVMIHSTVRPRVELNTMRFLHDVVVTLADEGMKDLTKHYLDKARATGTGTNSR